MIKAPFNFVPMSENVFFPDWANLISQDVPFSDGVSGVVKLQITAETPIFVRNGHTKIEALEKKENYKSFNNIDGKYFIPATSLKGSIRNVLEIQNFAKMSLVDNKRFSIRDLHLQEYTQQFGLADIHCGYMQRKGEKVLIFDHNLPFRISHKEVDDHLQTTFNKDFFNRNLLMADENRTAKYKYEKAKNHSFEIKFSGTKLMNPANDSIDKRQFIIVDKNGKSEGNIVFTGQPSVRRRKEETKTRKPDGKASEFVFPKEGRKIKEEFSLYDESGLFQDFCFIYKDSIDWNDYWKPKFEKGEKVPIFMKIKSEKLLHFGLSFLYKLPYPGKIKDYMSENHRSAKYDLADCIFGTAEKMNALKGRVQFSHAFCSEVKIAKEVAPYMGSPKPSYYPIYMQQKDNQLFSTMLNTNAKIKGWKRYPVQKSSKTNFVIPEGQEQNTNPFIPLGIGSKFSFSISFHNLKRIELGALLNALELENNGLHSIGFAKPLGFGAAKILVEEISGLDSVEIQAVRKEYSEFLKSQKVDISNATEIKELKHMTRFQNLNSPLEYMELADFVKCKKQNLKNKEFGEYLPYYSELIKPAKNNEEPKFGVANITLMGRIKQAELLDGKDLRAKELIVDARIKLNKGDKIEVELMMKGGNIEKLKFIKKL